MLQSKTHIKGLSRKNRGRKFIHIKWIVCAFLFLKGGYSMRTLKQELIDKGFCKQPSKNNQNKENTQPRFFKSNEINEDRKRREFEDLMGMRRPTYYRSKGSFRTR